MFYNKFFNTRYSHEKMEVKHILIFYVVGIVKHVEKKFDKFWSKFHPSICNV